MGILALSACSAQFAILELDEVSPFNRDGMLSTASLRDWVEESRVVVSYEAPSEIVHQEIQHKPALPKHDRVVDPRARRSGYGSEFRPPAYGTAALSRHDQAA